MSTPNDLQALLASIRPRPSPSSTQGQDTVAQHPLQYQQHGYRPHPQYQQPYDGQSLPHPHLHHDYRQPSVSSAIHSPSPVNNTPPHHGSDIMSPNVPTPRGGEMFPPHPQTQTQPQNADRSVNLLNLLKFNQSAAAPAQQQGPPMGMKQPRQTQTYNGPNASNHHGRNISASDLVASLFGRQGPGAAPAGSADFTPAAGEPIGAAESSASPVPTPENTQEMLLRLLNRSKPGQETTENLMKPIYQSSASASPMPEAESSTFVAPTVEAIEESLTSRPEEVIPGKPDVYVPQPSGPSSGSKESLFTYVNPFDQLAAASPRNKTPQPKSGSESPAMETARSKHISAATHAQHTAVSAEDERAKSPSLSEEQKEAVSHVVGNLVSQITRDVDETVAKSTKEEKKPAVATAPPDDTQDMLSSIASHLKETAADAKEEAEEEKLKETMKNIPATTAGPAAAAKEAFNIGNGDGLVDSWESAEDSAEKDEERVVAVHNFPLKPFISISVKSPSGKLVSLRDDGIMDIARLKKEFDQLDRSLTSATSEYIVYALAKNGGMRIIRQDDGRDKQVFRSTRDRVFNVAVCTSQTTHGASEEQAVLGIGVSGAVYWALISRAEKDLFELDALESESLIFPPFPASDENTSGGQLKTRAKRSSRHPGFFAIGRGKNIYVISPQAAADAAYGVSGTQRTVNTEKFFKERALKISTGKAGKDFIFSDDDTVIASLDKTGRLRFWDVRELVSNSTFLSNGFTPVEIRVPLSTFVTGSPTEKSWPTSVLFIDKLRPYVKSLALRYVLVGLKQNHTLQLWDIGLGKAVQELKFPHENESDAICSVAYHPASGIAVIGHPTRNSIYFVHLSAPRYNLQPMSQASFIKRASEKDNTLPKPESTACLSGIREISFASKGQLRSLDILPKAANEENELFELYVMHSRGVTCLTIKKEDLGWSTDNKIVRPVNALEQGLIEISELQAFPSYFNDEPSVNGDSASTSKSVPKEIAKKPESAEAAASAATGAMASTPRTQSPTKPILKKKDEQAESVSTTNGSDKADKKKKKKGGISEGAAKLREAATPSFTGSAEAATSQVPGERFNGHPAFKPTPPTMDSQTAILGAGPSDPNAWFEHMRTLQNGVSTEFNKSLGREIEGLYRRFDEERRNWDSASAAKQDQVLRLVSSTLSDNVEKNLARIVSNSIQSEVLPSLSDLTSTAVGKQLNTLVAQQMGNILPRELQQALPEAISRALKRPDVMKTLTDAIGQKVTSHIEGEMSKAVHTTLSPVMQSLRSLEKSSVDMEKKYETQRREYVSKIEELTSLVHGLADNVSSMTAAQSGFQDEILKLNRALANRGTRSSTPQSSSKSTAPQIPTERPNPTSRPQQPSAPVPSDSRSIDDAELTEVAQLMSHGRFEEGSVKWLQSSQQADLFDNLFVRLNPSYLTGLSPIVALSVGVAVTSSLETNVAQRLAWLEVVFQTVNPQDPDIREVAPQIMEILLQRLNGLYMTVAQNSPHDQVLPKISVLARYARQLCG